MNLKKYNQGIKDRLEGFPPNRLGIMRSDPEYMAGYNSGRVTLVHEAPKDGSGKTVPMGMLVALAKHGSESYRKDDYYDRETDLTEIAVRYGYTVTESAKEEGR